MAIRINDHASVLSTILLSQAELRQIHFYPQSRSLRRRGEAFDNFKSPARVIPHSLKLADLAGEREIPQAYDEVDVCRIQQPAARRRAYEISNPCRFAHRRNLSHFEDAAHLRDFEAEDIGSFVLNDSQGVDGAVHAFVGQYQRSDILSDQSHAAQVRILD